MEGKRETERKRDMRHRDSERKTERQCEVDRKTEK